MKKIFIFLASVLIIIAIVGFKYISYKNEYNIIQNENAEFEEYQEKELYGLNVGTIINKAVDKNTKTGGDIIIELRDRKEVTHINDKIICSDKVNIINPSFDVTPAELIKGIITEYGIFKPNEIYKLFE